MCILLMAFGHAGREYSSCDKQLKRLQTAKNEGGTDTALEDLLAVEQALDQAEKENRYCQTLKSARWRSVLKTVRNR